MDILSRIAGPVFVLGIVIFIHELGHLVVARMFDVRVLAFSLGFGKRLWGFERGGTDYRISLVPLGGYVKLGGEHPEEASDDPRDFVNKPRWQRILVYLAGPAANVVLALALMTGLFMSGVDVPPRMLPPVVGLVAEGSPAAEAGLAGGDRILEINGSAVKEWQQVDLAVMTSPARPLEILFQRGGERLSTTLTPLEVERYEVGVAGFFGPGKVWIRQVLPDTPAARSGLRAQDQVLAADGRPVHTNAELVSHLQQHPGDEVELALLRGGEPLTLIVVPEDEGGQGRIGALIEYGFYQRYPLGQAFVESLYYTIGFVRDTVVILGKIFTRQVAAKSALAGPIEIVAMTGTAAQQGFKDLLHLTVLISVSIAIVNLLPIPILDGGQTTILAVESVIRRDLSLRVKERLAQVGVVLIFALMLTVIFFDLQRRF